MFEGGKYWITFLGMQNTFGYSGFRSVLLECLLLVSKVTYYIFLEENKNYMIQWSTGIEILSRPVPGLLNSTLGTCSPATPSVTTLDIG